MTIQNEALISARVEQSIACTVMTEVSHGYKGYAWGIIEPCIYDGIQSCDIHDDVQWSVVESSRSAL
jgi:hypothetical protein